MTLVIINKNRRTSSWFMLLCSLVPLYFVGIFFVVHMYKYIKRWLLQTVPDRETTN